MNHFLPSQCSPLIIHLFIYSQSSTNDTQKNLITAMKKRVDESEQRIKKLNQSLDRFNQSRIQRQAKIACSETVKVEVKLI